MSPHLFGILIAIGVYVLFATFFNYMAKLEYWDYSKMSQIILRVLFNVQIPHILFRFVIPVCIDIFWRHKSPYDDDLQYYWQNITCNGTLALLLFFTWIYSIFKENQLVILVGTR